MVVKDIRKESEINHVMRGCQTSLKISICKLYLEKKTIRVLACCGDAPPLLNYFVNPGVTIQQLSHIA